MSTVSTPSVDPDAAYTAMVDSVAGLPQAELNTSLLAVELQRRALDARFAVHIGAADAAGLCGVDGHRSMSGYLKASCNYSGPQASQWSKVSKFVYRYRNVGAVWAAGHIGFAQVALLAATQANPRVRHRFDEFLPILLSHAEQLPFSSFEQTVTHFVTLADTDGTHTDRDVAVRHRNAHVVVNGAELDVTVTGGDPLVATEIVAIFDRVYQQELDIDLAARLAEHGDNAHEFELARTPNQRRFETFTRIFRAGGAAILNDPAAGRTAISEPMVNVIIDEDTFERMVADAGLIPTTDAIEDTLGELVDNPATLLVRRCETSAGTPIHPHDALRALLDGHIRRVVVDSNGVIINYGRSQRLFTGYARQAALLLVRTCDHPGCELPAEWCEVDHNVEWCEGGNTDQTNGRIKCRCHNVLKHQRKWRTRQATNGHHYTIRQDGTIMLPAGARPPNFPDEPDEPDDIIQRIRQRALALANQRPAS